MKIVSNNALDENKFNVAVFVFSFIGAALIKTAVSKSYTAITSKEFTDNPEHEDYNLREVLLFSITTGIIGAITKVFTKKLVTIGWKKAGGNTPKQIG
jgi:uncharacterized membrane protein YeaQ/YmgE (transglycosylase-associated protein family)